MALVDRGREVKKPVKPTLLDMEDAWFVGSVVPQVAEPRVLSVGLAVDMIVEGTLVEERRDSDFAFPS